MCGFPVHDLVAQREEPFRGQRFSEEVCEVLVGLDVRHDDFTIFHHLSDEEMPPINMLSACMMLWIVSKITSPFIVFEELNRFALERFELARKTFQVNRLFSGLRRAATISASQLESATLGCLFEPQEIAALESMNTQPDVE